MALSLIAFDTAHIKSYVFATNRLTEIRGASSLLDGLNRSSMRNIASDFKLNGISIETAPVYTNGGSGLFVVTADKETTEIFGRQVQREYREKSGGRASIDFAVQELPTSTEKVIMQALKDADKAALDKFVKETQEYRKSPVSKEIQDAMLRDDLLPQLELLRYKLRENKDSPPDIIALSSHPFMRPCDTCGTEYAEEPQDRDGQTEFYCASCRAKQKEDSHIKEIITETVKEIVKHPNQGQYEKESLWGRILKHLQDVGYFPKDASKLNDLDRPDDFNEFRRFTKSKDYLGLIYADANNMGTAMEKLPRLLDIYKVANYIDDSIHRAMSLAIKEHLPIEKDIERVVKKKKKLVPLFPFDILLLGGDDIVMVTDAAKAMDVAVTIAQEFQELANEHRHPLIDKPHTLSIGVVLAPVKYPFGLVRSIAESALKFAKTDGAEARKRGEDDTRINFLTVTGGSVNDFKKAFEGTYHKKDKVKQLVDNNEFYATLRPYKIKDLETLIKDIREAKRLRLGRTKLHQLRDAVLDKNLTTSVTKGLALLSNWREKERTFVARSVYKFGGHYAQNGNSQSDLPFDFPRVTFPWFVYGKNDDGQLVYRTPLLDFIELYDFVVAREGKRVAMANDRIHIAYKLTFTTPFHCGTGLRVGLIDRTIVRDKDGYLYVPGSTIKGVVREYCEQLSHLYDEDVDRIYELIGKADKTKTELDKIREAIASPHDDRAALWALTQPISMTTRIFGARHYPGHLFFEDARQTDESKKEYDSKETDPGTEDDDDSKGKYKSLQTDLYTQARLDRPTRTAVTGALYTSEFGVKDFTFEGSINGWLQCNKIKPLIANSEGPTYSLLLLLAGLHMIDRLGGNKSAGKGKCRCEVGKVKLNNKEYEEEQWQSWFDHLDQLAHYADVEQGGEV